MSLTLAAVLAVSLTEVVGVTSVEAAPPAPAVCPADRVDATSAHVTARLCGKKIEISRLTTENTRVYANPDGTRTAEVSGGPVRVKRGTEWDDVDLTLVRGTDGSITSKAHPRGLRLSGAATGTGEHELASAGGADGGRIAMVWHGALPTPQIDGSKATYPQVRPGVDLVVQATPTGYDQFLIVGNRAGVAHVASIPLSLRPTGWTTRPDGNGGLDFTDRAGRVAARSPQPLMWDAKATPHASEPRAVARVATAPRKAAAPGELLLTPDTGWLNDPARVFPLTVDPQVSINPTFDTYVKESEDGIDRSGMNDLEIGRMSGSVLWRARSLLHWPTAQFAGGRISSATFNFWNWYSTTCAQTPWEIWTVGPFDASARWSNQPAWRFPEATSTQTKGLNSTCDDGTVSIDGKQFFQRAADELAPIGYMGIRATREDLGDGWKQFRSMNNTATSVFPSATVTFSAAPQVSSPGTNPATTCTTGAGRPYIGSATPRVQVTVSDAESAPSQVMFEWWNAGGGKIGETTVANVPSGSVASTVVPSGVFSNGGTYSWRARATDTVGSGAWSPSCEFTVDTVKPGVPFVSSTDYPNDNAWHGRSGQAGTFVFKPAAGTSDLNAYVYQLDTDTTGKDVAATGETTVSITPAQDGHRTLTVRAKDKAGNLSDPATYTFQVGRAGLNQPSDGANVVNRMKLAIDGDTTLTRATFQYRRGPGGTEYDIPLPHLRTAQGSAITDTKVRVSTLGGHATWNATDTLGTVGGVVQVRARLFTDNDADPSYDTQWVTATVDPNGDGAASASAGPGSVNLLTGDYSVEAADANEFGLAVSRAASSRETADGWVPQGERLNPNQRQISTDTAGFSTGTTSTLARVTTRGQGSSTDSLEITPTFANGDTYAAIGSEYNLALGMKPGKSYRAAAWIYVPAETGLTPTFRQGLQITGFYKQAGVYKEISSVRAGWTGAWQELTVDLALPSDATEAFFRLYNGMAGGSGKKVYYDNISVREVIAPFGRQWRGGIGGGAAENDYAALAFPSPELAQVEHISGGYQTFARSNTGAFFPEPGAEDLALSKVDDNTYRLTESDGTIAEFGKLGEKFVLTSTWTAGDVATTRYLYDLTDNRALVKRVINPTEPGIGDCTGSIPARGCEVLEYDYASANTATASTFGDVVDRVRAVKLWSWDPATSAMSTVDVTRYTYDQGGRLREVWDPRLATPLKTGYEYDAGGRLSSLTAPGDLPVFFDYGSAAGDPSPDRLLRVRRPALAAGSPDQVDGELTTNIVYGVPLTRSAGGPHDMDAVALARVAQKDLPTDATAIFDAESDPGTNSASQTTPGANGYGFAGIHYLNASGQEVNVATPGGHIDTKEYDRFGNVIRTLESTNRALAFGTLPDADRSAAELALPADSAERARLLSTYSTYNPDGVDLIETVGPVARAALENDLIDPSGLRPTLPAGTEVVARGRVVNSYDQDKPDGTAYHLITTQTRGGAITGYPDADVRVTRHDYGAEKGGTSGWTVRKPTSTTTDAGTTYAVYDSGGRSLAAWGIGATGLDPRTTKSVYYTAGANAADSACGNRPEWAGQVCVKGPAGPASGHDPARMATDLPVKRIEEYSRFGEVTKTAETAAGKTRRVLTTYDAADRVKQVEVVGDDGLPVPAIVTGYDDTSGREISTSMGTLTIRRDYDKLGRLYTYTDADLAATRSEFDRLGRLVKVIDSKGWTGYEYDRAKEPRGLLTAVTDSVAGRFEAKYSPDEKLVETTYPGGLVRKDRLDSGFNPVERSYTRGSDGTVLYAESIVENSQGQWVSHTYTGGRKKYGYDRVGRLVQASQVDATGTCTTRDYGHDGRTNRTSRQTFGPAQDGSCQTGVVAEQRTHSYDSADRIADAGYVYDAFGRTTATPDGLANGYYVNDLVASQQKGDTHQQWTLDPRFRLRGDSTQKLEGGSWTNAGSRRFHYADDSDEPRWIVDDVTSGAISRNVSGPDADLAATTSATGDVKLTLTNLHGDVAVTVDVALTAPVFHDYDEFGVARSGQPDQRYGWLGGKQRSGDALGDTILMGVRLYSPSTGRFLQVDPVAGGSCNAYEYVCGDPVNMFDLDGRWGWLKKAAKWVSDNAGTIGTVIGTVSMFLPPPANIIGGAIGLGFSAWGAYNDAKEKKWGSFALSVVGMVPGVGAVAKGAKWINATRSLRGARGAIAKYKPSYGSKGIKNKLVKAMRATRRIERKAQRGFERWDKWATRVTYVEIGKSVCQNWKGCKRRAQRIPGRWM